MSDRPVHNVTINMQLLEEITAIVTPNLKALNETVTARWPVAPDMYLTLAIGMEVGILLGNLSDPTERMNAVDGINAVVRYTGFALTPVT